MVKRGLVLAALLAAALPGEAGAQIAPGVRLPDNVAEAVLMAQLFGCTSAASGRLAYGLNIPLEADQTNVALHEALPDNLAARVGPLGSESRILSLEAPDGAVWMAFDPAARRCVVTGLAVDPPRIREELMPIFESDRSPWQAAEPAVSADGRRLPRYEWRVRATPRLGTPAVHMRATIDLPETPGQQLLITTEAVGD